VGDWDGDGKATPGTFKNGTFFLRNTNTTGIADITFTFGLPGDLPVAGTGTATASTRWACIDRLWQSSS
jgi:hypothetical protein